MKCKRQSHATSLQPRFSYDYAHGRGAGVAGADTPLTLAWAAAAGAGQLDARIMLPPSPPRLRHWPLATDITMIS